jgi:hypothetical protein
VASAPISSGTLKLAVGCFYSIKALDASSLDNFLFSAIISICFWIRGVKTNPGQIALIVMPFLAFYKALALVKPTIPCLAAT